MGRAADAMRDLGEIIRGIWPRWGWHLNVIGIFCGLSISIYGAIMETDVMLHARRTLWETEQAARNAIGLIIIGWLFTIILSVVLVVRHIMRYRRSDRDR